MHHIKPKNTNELQKLGKKCATDTAIIKFDRSLQNHALDLHNKHRNEIASGAVKGFDKAARMATLVSRTTDSTH